MTYCFFLVSSVYIMKTAARRKVSRIITKQSNVAAIINRTMSCSQQQSSASAVCLAHSRSMWKSRAKSIRLESHIEWVLPKVFVHYMSYLSY